jgi:hypothetical protein
MVDGQLLLVLIDQRRKLEAQDSGVTHAVDGGDTSIEERVGAVNGQVFEEELDVDDQFAQPDVTDEARVAGLELLQATQDKIGLGRPRWRARWRWILAVHRRESLPAFPGLRPYDSVLDDRECLTPLAMGQPCNCERNQKRREAPCEAAARAILYGEAMPCGLATKLA